MTDVTDQAGQGDMRAVVQRVSEAEVHVGGRLVAAIGRGVLVLLGVADGDTESEVEYLAGKVSGLRIFEDQAGKMNLSVQDVAGEALVVPNFTVCGDCRKGRRPSFTRAANPRDAEMLFGRFAENLQRRGVATSCGAFGAHMKVSLVNDGPVTLVVESPQRAGTADG